jgi:DNA repair exonuclease SbcCD ATPase subunit
MMIRKFLGHSICLISLVAVSFPVNAGKLYRFPDESGVMTLSRSLPPEAAQKGYDILDDQTMRVIEHVTPAPTQEEIIELEAEKALQQEQEHQARLRAEQAEQDRQKQAQYDRTLLMTYPTEADLIAARDKDISYREEQIAVLSAKLPKLRQTLESIQKEAAERELSGAPISKNMQKRLNAAQQEISVRKQAIAQYQTEIKELELKYQQDLARLRELRGTASD